MTSKKVHYIPSNQLPWVLVIVSVCVCMCVYVHVYVLRLDTTSGMNACYIYIYKKKPLYRIKEIVEHVESCKCCQFFTI